MNWKVILISVSIAFLIGIGVGYEFLPSVFIEKTKTVATVNKRRNVVKTITEKPDGTKTTVIVDKSTIDSNSTTDKSKEIKRTNLNWIVSGYYLKDLNNNNEIIGSIQRRIIGEIYVGVIGSSKGFAGVGVSIRF